MVVSFFAAYPNIDQLDAMPMLVFLVGALLLVGAFLRVADLGQYISRSVVVAYLSGAAVQMIIHQLPKVLGISEAAHGVLKSGKLESRTLLGEVGHVLTSLHTISVEAMTISCAIDSKEGNT